MSANRRNIMLGTAGHVDHGKSALVKLLTGCETDTLAEEKQRGLTIDLGFAPCRLSDARVVGIVDVPGHVDFIRNMVAGAQGIDVAILVVAADDGLMPQTREHLHILELMGLRHGLVALTKVDLVDTARRESVASDLRDLASGTFLEGAPVCPISNVTGEGFDAFFDSLNRIVAACADRPTSGIFRVWVDDAFTIRGSGTVVTGIPVRGAVHLEDRLVLAATPQIGRVRRMQVYGEEATSARAGECVALNIPELDYCEMRRGMLLTEVDQSSAADMAEAELRILPSFQGTLDDFPEVQLHIGTAALQAHVAMLESGSMAAGDRQMVQLRLAEPLPLAPGERFVIRCNVAGSRGGLTTVGGGRILGVSGTRLRRKKAWTLQMLADRRDAIDDPEAWCGLMIRETLGALLPVDLGKKCGLHLEELSPILERLISSGAILRTSDGLLVHSDNLRAAAEKLSTVLRRFHEANPRRAGADHQELLVQTALPATLYDMATGYLLGRKEVVAESTVLAMAGWKPELAQPEEEIRAQLGEVYRKAGWTPPSTADLAQSLSSPVSRVETLVRLLTERGILVRLDDRIIMHRDAIDAAKQVALRLFERGPVFSTMQFRDALNVSRKYAVPLLDHLDKIRFTVRRGNERSAGVAAKSLLA